MNSFKRLCCMWALAFSACTPQVSPVSEAEAKEFVFSAIQSCEDGRHCLSGVCQFGQCAGLSEIDEPWKMQVILTQARHHLGLEAENMLFDAIVARANQESLVIKARMASALALLDHPQVKPQLATWHREAKGALRELMVLARAQAKDPEVLEDLLDIAERDNSYQASVALRLLGPLQQEPALVVLLSYLSPELDLEVVRSAIDGLRTLEDLRAIKPLREFLVLAPEALTHDVSTAMTHILSKHYPNQTESLARLGSQARAWDEVLNAYDVPSPPKVLLRTHATESDLDLPTP